MAKSFRPLIVLLLLVAAVQPVAAAGTSRDAFVKRWEGKRVIVKQTMFTLVFNQRGKVGLTSRKREGLQLVSLSGSSLLFKGRFEEEDIVTQDPDKLVEIIRDTYIRAYTFDIGSYHRVDPITVERFEAGSVFIVHDVRVEDDTVHLSFSALGDDRKGEDTTDLTVHWDVPLSKSLTEAPLVENLIRQYVDLVDATPQDANQTR